MARHWRFQNWVTTTSHKPLEKLAQLGYNDQMVLTHADGLVARTPEDAEQARAAGYVQCATTKSQNGGMMSRGLPCQFYISPEAQSAVIDKGGGYYTCPVCAQSHDLLHELPWHGVSYDEGIVNQRADQAANGWQVGGGTRIGLGMDAQAQIGENLVESLHEIPGYGPITWWHQGGATANSPLDGATKDWGVEVKTLGYDAIHHRFVPGRPREKEDKNQHAADMGKLGVLGVLVLLDYRRSVADIYVQEFPSEKGVGAFRSHNGQHLVKEVPFKNPLMDPHDPQPHSEGLNNSGMPF